MAQLAQAAQQQAAYAHETFQAAVGTPLPPVPGDARQMGHEVVSAQATANYAQALQDLQGVAKHLEKVVREGERAATMGSVRDYILGTGAAVEACATAAHQAASLAALPEQHVAPQILESGRAALERTSAAQVKLGSSLKAMLKDRLRLAGWPPPLAKPGGARPGGPPVSWAGFQAADPAIVGELQRLLAALIAFQRSCDPLSSSQLAEAESARAVEGPQLWAVSEVAAPLGDRLRLHFAAGLPTDRVDRPEWLFATALKIVKEHAQGLAPLQPAIEAHGLQDIYYVPFEFARAIRSVVQEILRERLLPRLVAGGNAAHWLHFVEEAVQFERQLAPLRGLALGLPSDEEGPELWNRGSCLELVCSDTAWRESWWEAERVTALAALDDLLDSVDAWSPAGSAWGLGSDDPLLPPYSSAAPAVSASPAYQSEFYPSVAAEGALQIVEGLARKCAWIGNPLFRREFAAAVPEAVLKSLLARLTRLARTAEEFQDLASEVWGPRLAAYICAAHFIEHRVREAEGPLLLLDLDVVENGHKRGSVLSSQADSFSRYVKKWTLKLAKAVGTRFVEATAVYRKPPNLETFAQPGPDPSGDEVSLKLKPALEGLAATLALLADHMDQVVFREMWRAVAVAANRMMYNEIATEARFSSRGARQFSVDVAALRGVFQAYTPRPAAHFREASEAASLLMEGEDRAVALAHTLASDPAHAGPLMKHMGVTRLTPQQARCVLSMRLE
eukprot:jgi/Botrbrau1/5046/Bobra.37_1s0012.1